MAPRLWLLPFRFRAQGNKSDGGLNVAPGMNESREFSVEFTLQQFNMSETGHIPSRLYGN